MQDSLIEQVRALAEAQKAILEGAQLEGTMYGTVDAAYFVQQASAFDFPALLAHLERMQAVVDAARAALNWRGDLTALYEKRNAICRSMKDCKHCAKWVGHPITSMCCESGTPNHYGQLRNIDEEIRREQDRCIIPHEVRTILTAALENLENNDGK